MEHIAAIASAVGSATIGFVAAILTHKHKSKKQQGDAANAHLKTFYETVNGMMSQQEERHQRAFEILSKEQSEERFQMAEERKIWSAERQKLYDKIDKIQETNREYQRALHEKEIEVAQLRVEVRLLTERLDAVGAPA